MPTCGYTGRPYLDNVNRLTAGTPLLVVGSEGVSQSPIPANVALLVE